MQRTGKVLVEKKFYKSDFNEVWADPEYLGYVDALLSARMTRKLSNSDEAVLDTESYEEVRAAAMEINLEDIPDLDA